MRTYFGCMAVILHAISVGAGSVPLDLTSFFNHKAFGSYPGEAAFDAQNRSFPALNDLAPQGTYTSSRSGIVYDFPAYTGPDKPDNVVCNNQTIRVPGKTNAFSVSMLVANDLQDETNSKNITYVYSDGSTAQAELRALSFFTFLTLAHGEIVSPFSWTATGRDWNASQIFEFTGSLDPERELEAIVLPSTTNVTKGRIHVFSVSLWQGEKVVGSGGAAVEVQDVRGTQKWTAEGNQVVEVMLNNAGTECLAGKGLNVSVEGCGVVTVEPARLKRLCPGDQKRVDVGVRGKRSGAVTVALRSETDTQKSVFLDVQVGFETFTEDLNSISKHESPDWFDNAKYGIFIHWGPYAVPGWGGVAPNETYAEWFWWYSTHHDVGADRSDDYDYRLKTFGPEWRYDDSFSNFTGAAWDPKDWVDLFADAGATYFVITTKHHDGFALFDTGNTTGRSALNYGPKRDIVKDLFDASAKYQPDLKRGTYFSLPEWFNPDFGPYGFAQTTAPSATSWLGIAARNPYTNETEPYTGRTPIGDYIADLQVPQMEILAYDYGTDIMWCDCGAANGSAAFAARWWNTARRQGRQVAMNSRCGVPQAADFETPEYATYSSAQRHKWESNRGMDPYSYGYNRATPGAAYMDAGTIVYSLVDIVAKNGNFLLDIGPRADGTVVQAEADNLREAGAWIKGHAEAIFNTTYWFVQTQIASPEVRFTQTEDAFYILFLEEPVVEDGAVLVDAPVPILDGDLVSLLGIPGAGDLAWTRQGEREGPLSIQVSAEQLALEHFCWVFKIEYNAS